MNLVIDFECNGVEYTSEPLTAYTILERDGNIHHEQAFTFTFRGKWNKEAASVHGLDEYVCRNNQDQTEDLINLIRDNCSHNNVICHALYNQGYYDSAILHWLFFMHFGSSFEYYKCFNGTISTIELLKEAVLKGSLSPIKAINKAGKSYHTYKLDKWCQFFGIDLDHHDAKSDTLACFEIYKS